jgi:hypothetical protein
MPARGRDVHLLEFPHRLVCDRYITGNPSPYYVVDVHPKVLRKDFKLTRFPQENHTPQSCRPKHPRNALN